jgi:hypothetical protein
MINRQALVVVLAAAAMNASAFVVPSASYTIQHHTVRQSSSLFSTIEDKYQKAADLTAEAEKDLELTRQVIMDHISASDADSVVDDEDEAPKKLIMDIPPAPVAPPKPASAKKAAPKKKGNPHKEGVFSPIVVAAGAVLGEEQLNKIRGKVIAVHSDIIKSFVDTSDSAFGKAVLKQLFEAVDTDNSGYLDKEEVAVALNLLGFKWLKEKQVAKIFERADANGDMEISLEEFMVEAPKTLKTNLVKLAKQNGGDMGLLV